MKRLFLVVLVISLAAVASFGQKNPSKRTSINLPRPVANLPFSDAVLVGNTMYLSGRLGLDPATGKVPADVKDELRLLLGDIKAVLAKGGMTMDNLVYVQVFCPDLSLYGAFNEAYRAHFRKDFPARAFVGSGPLLFGARFEIQAIAVK